MRTQIRLPSSQRPSGQKQRLFARASGAAFDTHTSGSATVIEFYDEVGAYGISAKAFAEQLKAVRGDIVLRINSPGGDVFEGTAIANLLAAHPGNVRVEIVGIAASIASIIAMSGDEIAIAENAYLMIHNSWSLTVGNRHDHADTEELLTQIDQTLAATYAARTGLSPAACAGMMDDETWLVGGDAKAKGFATELMGEMKIGARFDLSIYGRAPESLREYRADASTNLSSPVELEKLLRNAGLSRRQAKAVSFNGWAGIAGTETSEITSLAERVATAAAELKRTA